MYNQACPGGHIGDPAEYLRDCARSRIVENQYRYQYRWSAVIGVALLGAALAAGTIWLALSEHRPWILIFAVPLVAMLVLSGRTALINLDNPRCNLLPLHTGSRPY